MILKLFRLLRRCIDLAIPFGRGRLVLVAVVIFLNGVFELIGVASVLPFFALATNPEEVLASDKGQWVLSHLPEMETSTLLIWAGLASIFLLFLANGMGLLNQVVRVKYGFAFGHSLRTRMMRSLAQRPYSYFLNQNSGALLQKTVDDVGRFINDVFLPLLDVISRSVTISFLVTAAILANPQVAFGAAALFITFYLIVFLFVRKHSLRIGAQLRETNKRLMVSATQFFGAMKTVLVHDKADYFINRFAENSEKQARLLPRARLFSFFPRTIIEPLAYGALVGIVVFMASRGQSLVDILPRLTVMAVAGMRLIPAFQSLYAQLNQVTTMHYTLGELESEIKEVAENEGLDRSLKKPATRAAGTRENTGKGAGEANSISFRKAIRLQNITWQYPDAPEPVIDHFNLTIPRHSSVGLIGPTGSGKSTLVDLILGLHQPQSGHLVIDDRPLYRSDMKSWRNLIGYVPQDIYLIDASIAENIAFGIPPEEIDHSLLLQVARAAQIEDFVEQQLPARWQTQVGERGVRLSGGQRQRIGLARALYTRPEILILDEATSALDVQTEKEVMKAINALQGTLTIIMIAHRLSTIEACHQVIDLSTVGGKASPASGS